ncbi:MAG: hypothetical protein E7087_05325 [Bacteroidales bacterium]|nr:hypothetical protein [Bacteroidales bacterium]
MRKNLFLTFALLLASFATVNAQWSQTMSALDGFAGVADEQTGCKTIKTGLITPDSPIEGLRITIVDTEAPELNKGVTMAAFAEIKVLDGEGNALNFTPTSNSIQTGGADGGGMPALNDGDYNTYYHSYWGGSGTNDRAEGEYVYVELAFDQPVEAFRLMLVSRKNTPKFTPTVAVLTPAGVVGVPGEVGEVPQGEFTLGERLTTMDDVVASPYVALKTNTLKEWTKDKETYEWVGPYFVTGTGSGCYVSADSTHLYNYAMAMTVTESAAVPGTYHFYSVDYDAYFSKVLNGYTQKAYNGQDNWQGWQVGDRNEENAADIVVDELANGRFEFSYEVVLDTAATKLDEPVVSTAYIAAHPIPTGGRPLKTFDGNNKAALKSGIVQSETYGYPVAFDFEFYACTYVAPLYLAQAELNGYLFDAANAIASYGGLQDSEANWGYEGYYDALVQAIEDGQALIDGGAGSEELEAYADVVKEAIVWYLYTVAYQKFDEIDNLYTELSDGGLFCSNDALEVGKYTEESFESIVRPHQTVMEVLYGDVESFGADYSLYPSLVAGFADYEAALKQFYAGKVVATPWPATFTSADGLHVTGAAVWQSPLIRPDFNGLTGFRITFLEVAPNNGMYGGYPMVSLSEFAVKDVDGNTIPLTDANITCNSIATNEGSNGPLSNLLDGDRSTFYHSTWGGGDAAPSEYVYFDVELPDTYVGITIEWIARDHSNPFSPKKVCVGPYGEKYDPIAESENTYNVTVGAQVAEASQIQDWGLYAIKGLLDTNASVLSEEQLGKENWYSGTGHFHTTVVREDCAYFFVKNSDGTFNILNLKSSKFWGADATEVNTTSEAADINIVKSTNAAFSNTFVLYSVLPETTIDTASFKYVFEDKTDSIEVAEVEVPTTYNVFMDWAGGLARRNCVAPQPGIADASIWGEQAVNVEKVTEYLQAKSSAGDYLHFNKTNGEGEWKIYRLTMDNPYFYWLTSLVGIAESMGITEGVNPGQFVDTGDFAADYAAAQAVVEAQNYAGAEAAAKKLAATMEATVNGNLVRNPITEGVYIFEAAHSGYGGRKAMYVKTLDDGSHDLAWGNKPEDYTTEEGKTFLFQLETSPYVDDLIADGVITEDLRECVYFIKNVATGEYVQNYTGDPAYTFSFTTDNQAAFTYIFKRGTTDIYTINTDGQGHLHTEGHSNGNGNAGDIVNWNGTPDNTSASAWRLIKYVEETTLPGDIDGDGEVLVADVTVLVAMILGDVATNAAADVDGDGEVLVADATALVSIILGKDTASAAPAKAAATRAGEISTVSADGDGETLLININNPGYPFSAIQFDLELPEGIEVDFDGEYYAVDLGSRTNSRKHSYPECAIQPDGSLRVVIISMSNALYNGTEGDVATASLKVNGAADGDYQFTIKNVVLSAPGSKEKLEPYTGWINVTGGVTGIDEITAEAADAAATAIYDLQGRKVNSTVKGGIYIQNGKKFIAE